MEDAAQKMQRRLQAAQQGYRAFRRLQKERPADRYVLFRDRRLVRTAIDYFDAYANRFPQQTRFALLFEDAGQLSYGSERIKTDARKWIVAQEVQQQFIAAYALCDLSAAMTVVSLSEPYDTGAWRLYGKSGVGFKELVCFDIYGLDQVPQIFS